MKIVHLIFAFPIGGKEAMLVDIINEQSKYETITLIILNDYYNINLITLISNKVSVYLLKRKVGSKNPIPLLKLNYILARINPSIIHCHDYSLASLITPLIKGKKLLTIHSMNICIKNRYKYDQLFAISKAVQNDIKNRSKCESIVVYNGIRVANIQFKNGNKSEKFRIVQVGRLDHNLKGQHILLESLSRLIYKYNLRNLHLDIIGEGISLNYLLGLANELNISNYVSFMGLRDRTYIYSHLQDYDLLVQPSLFEGFGLTIVEALAAGIEVLVSDIDGPLEIIENIGHGNNFKSGNADDCALKIFEIYSNCNVLNSPTKYELQRRACKDLFDVEVTAKKYLAEYLSVSILKTSMS
jgi:glycosyltransferase involved in cell wall biosynthesis